MQARFFPTATLFCLLLCAGCADIKGPEWLTGEPEDEVLAAPRAVGTPSRAGLRSWPNLSEVPAQRPDFTDMDMVEQDRIIMNSNRLKADVIRQRMLHEQDKPSIKE
ncbi:MAG: hypothetical protein FWF24_03010 [Alphaproteobacteria bacterium]|nr:hypothetical protein [Alphaproteobacteria bacterium]